MTSFLPDARYREIVAASEHNRGNVTINLTSSSLKTLTSDGMRSIDIAVRSSLVDHEQRTRRGEELQRMRERASCFALTENA